MERNDSAIVIRLKGVKDFILKIVDSFFKVGNLCVITFVTGTASIFNNIAKMIVKVLIADEVPDFYCSACVMAG